MSKGLMCWYYLVINARPLRVDVFFREFRLKFPMYVCMYVFMYVYVYMYVCVYLCMYACMYVLCMYVCVCVCIYVCMYVCMYVRGPHNLSYAYCAFHPPHLITLVITRGVHVTKFPSHHVKSKDTYSFKITTAYVIPKPT